MYLKKPQRHEWLYATLRYYVLSMNVKNHFVHFPNKRRIFLFQNPSAPFGCLHTLIVSWIDKAGSELWVREWWLWIIYATGVRLLFGATNNRPTPFKRLTVTKTTTTNLAMCTSELCNTVLSLECSRNKVMQLVQRDLGAFSVPAKYTFSKRVTVSPLTGKQKLLIWV